MYDDGLSCPAGCDAHVVFHDSLNGTEHAHDPSTPKPPYQRCRNDTVCRICLESGGKQCLEVVYRGAGPKEGRFDFTPAFYEAACAKSDSVPALATKCKQLAAAAAGLASRINCIRSPTDSKCEKLVEAARASYEADRVEYQKCKGQGEKKYNSTRPITEQRSNGCAYEARGSGGPNSAGDTWKKLLPGACRAGTFVGRDGLDCCSGNTFADGPLGVECIAFYAKGEGRKP